MRINKEHIQKTLTETVLALCQTGIPFDAELSIEGLLGITLDKDNIILVNIKEVIRHDMPKDYSTKGTEKRKAQIDPDLSNKRHKEAPKRSNHSFIPEGYTSQDDGDYSQPTGGATSLKIPLIPPEFVHAASQMVHMRDNQVKYVRQKHTEISRMLALQSLQAANERPRSASSDIVSYSPELQLLEAHNHKDAQKNAPQSVVNLAQDYVAPSRSLGPFAAADIPVPVNLESRPASVISSTMPTDLRVSAPSTRNSNQVVFPGDMPALHTARFAPTPSSYATSQPIGVVMDTNVQPPAPLAVVGGAGMIQSVPGLGPNMGPQSEHDFMQDLPEGTAIVQPVEIVPEEDIRLNEGALKKERHQATSKKDKDPLQMGRPKKSKEFCRFRCTICNAASSRKFNLQRHVNSHHPNAANCIIDLTPPKNPRQMRMKAQSDMKLAGYDSALYGLVTPEGVSLDSVMDLSISPSPDKMMLTDDEDIVYEESDDVRDAMTPTPPPAMSFVAGTGTTTVVDEMTRACTPVNNTTNVPPSPVKPTDNHSSPDAKKRFAKNKKSLDNMLFNKFGKYHSFPAEDGAQSDSTVDLNRESNTPDEGIDQSNASDVTNQSKAKDLNAINDNVELQFASENRTEQSELIDTESTEDEATNTTDEDSKTPEKDDKRNSDASDIIAIDANANNKSDMAVTQSQFSPDVNGNSKSKQSAVVTESNTACTNAINGSSSSEREKCTISEITAVKSDKLDKLSDIEAMVDYADNSDSESNDHILSIDMSAKSVDSQEQDEGASSAKTNALDSENANSEENEEILNSEDESKKLKTVAIKDNTRTTRRSINSNTENESDDLSEVTKNATPLSPRKTALAKSTLREPIKTRTVTRSSSVTTRRSSAREEIDAK